MLTKQLVIRKVDLAEELNLSLYKGTSNFKTFWDLKLLS